MAAGIDFLRHPKVKFTDFQLGVMLLRQTALWKIEPYHHLSQWGRRPQFEPWHRPKHATPFGFRAARRVGVYH
jgi:hypothetical protein